MAQHERKQEYKIILEEIRKIESRNIHPNLLQFVQTVGQSVVTR